MDASGDDMDDKGYKGQDIKDKTWEVKQTYWLWVNDKDRTSTAADPGPVSPRGVQINVAVFAPACNNGITCGGFTSQTWHSLSQRKKEPSTMNGIERHWNIDEYRESCGLNAEGFCLKIGLN